MRHAPQRIPDVCYEGFARSLGLHGIAVDKPDQVGPAWDQALAADRPSIPAIPPHVSFEQAKDVAVALLEGAPDRWTVLKEGVMTKAREILPGKGD
jgi:pyruvate dehydrogenase (quinone)